MYDHDKSNVYDHDGLIQQCHLMLTFRVVYTTSNNMLKLYIV